MQENERNERNILFIYTLYTIAMLLASFVLQWGYRVELTIFVGAIICWRLYITQYKNYQFRAVITSLIALMNFIVYGCKAESFFAILVTMSALVIFLAIYGIKEIMYLTFGASWFLFIYHAFLAKTIHMPDSKVELARMILQIGSIFTVECITYFLVKSQVSTNKRLEKMIEELKLAENSKSDFMANVSHEIRTPVNAVCGISEMMLMEELTPQMKENVHDVQMAGRNLHRIISDLLDFTELQSGQFSLIEEPYNLTSTINDVMNMTIAQLENANIDFIVDCDAQIPRSLVGDEQKIRRVMVNILNNAVKFTKEGCIRLSIGYRKENYGINLIVNIKDTGIGIKEDKLEKIFTNFNQVDTKKNRKEGGVGLGLAISKALVQKMGGFIKIQSEWEKGTEVQFVISQKVLDEHPIIEVKDAKEKRLLGYINLEKYKYRLTRDSYTQMLGHIAQQLMIPYHSCRNLGEVKRRIEKESFTHLFIGWEEYKEDPKFFETAAEKIPSFLIIDRYIAEQNIELLDKSKLYQIIKPFYALSIANVLNGDTSLLRMNDDVRNVRFVAPGAAILVVDDSLMNLKIVEGLLRPYQINVFTAESGMEALKKIERCDFDFVFMDHMMPEMDGVETLHKIRRKPGNYFQTVPIIALTANAVGGAREMFLQEGFQDFVSKPIEMPVLERVLKKYIPDGKKIYSNTTAKINSSINKVADEKHMVEIDTSLGIQYAGGQTEDYLEIVDVYCMTGRKKLLELQKYFELQDWKNYTILVHAVKSTSLGIGAKKLSELAKSLEEAGKEENVEYISRHHDNLCNLYEIVMNEAEQYILVKQTKTKEKQAEIALQEISKQQMQELLERLTQAIDTFEAECVLPIIEEMQTYQYKELKLQETSEQIREKIESFEFIGAEEIVQHLEEMLG